MALASKTFRIFVGSTFSDMKEERNALQERVFPRLRELCLQHGTRFQAIDLRWGVREEAALDQQTMKICLNEVHRCQKTSPRPNFIVLLGNRYGWHPLPAEIPAKEFEEIEKKAVYKCENALKDNPGNGAKQIDVSGSLATWRNSHPQIMLKETIDRVFIFESRTRKILNINMKRC